MTTKTVKASELGAKLNSNVDFGGGTDDTAIIQAFLDEAKSGETSVCLIMDGAALITGIKVYSNTTIHALNDSCGFYLADGSNCPVITNGNQSYKGEIRDVNILLEGGVYNQNCLNQEKIVLKPEGEGYCGEKPIGFADQKLDSQDMVVAVLFAGVKNLKLIDITIRDQRNYAGMFRNWENILCDNILIDLPNKRHHENQDGLHFHGPGKDLTIKNLRGSASDDFIALAPDEVDWESSITDVLIDGVQLRDADQGIRLLCCHNGRLDRVVIKNVTGTYRSFGFFINPFTNCGVNKGAGYGNITIDTLNLLSTGIDYDYTEPFIIRAGGHIEALSIKNIQNVNPENARYLVDVGLRYCTDDCAIPESDPQSEIGSLLIDGINSYENTPIAADTDFIRIHSGNVRALTVKNVNVVREDCCRGGKLVHVCKDANIETFNLSDVYAENINEIVGDESHNIGSLNISNISVKNSK